MRRWQCSHRCARLWPWHTARTLVENVPDPEILTVSPLSQRISYIGEHRSLRS